MLLLQHLCRDTAPVCHWIQEKKGHVVIKNMIDSAWRMRRNSIICHHLSPVFQDVPLSKEEYPIHRLSPAFGSVGGAPVRSIFLQIITSSNSIIHLKSRLQISSPTGPMEEVGCRPFWYLICLDLSYVAKKWIVSEVNLSTASRPYQFSWCTLKSLIDPLLITCLRLRDLQLQENLCDVTDGVRNGKHLYVAPGISIVRQGCGSWGARGRAS